MSPGLLGAQPAQKPPLQGLKSSLKRDKQAGSTGEWGPCAAGTDPLAPSLPSAKGFQHQRMTNGAMNVEIGNPTYKMYEGEPDDDVGELLDADFALDPDKVRGTGPPWHKRCCTGPSGSDGDCDTRAPPPILSPPCSLQPTNFTNPVYATLYMGAHNSRNSLASTDEKRELLSRGADDDLADPLA